MRLPAVQVRIRLPCVVASQPQESSAKESKQAAVRCIAPLVGAAIDQHCQLLCTVACGGRRRRSPAKPCDKVKALDDVTIS